MGFTFGKSTILAGDFRKLFLVKRHLFIALLSTLDDLVTKCALFSTLMVMGWVKELSPLERVLNCLHVVFFETSNDRARDN